MYAAAAFVMLFMVTPAMGTRTIQTKNKDVILHGGSSRPVNNSRLDNNRELHKYAVISHRHSTGDIHGITATLNVWRPRVEDGDLSISQVWIVNDLAQERETIEAGWMIVPAKRPQANPILFVFYTPDGYRSKCYNLDCGGFEWIDRSIEPGALELDDWTVFGDRTQKEFTISINQDIITGNWSFWFDGRLIGIWPGSLFPNLGRGANIVQWGGEVVEAPASNHPTTTEMGSGRFAEDGHRNAAYMSNAYYFDSKNDRIRPDSIDYFGHRNAAYTVSTLTRESWFLFGGPGGNDRKCVDSETNSK